MKKGLSILISLALVISLGLIIGAPAYAQEDGWVASDLGPAWVAVLGDYQSQLTDLLLASGISAEPRDWDVVGNIHHYEVVVINLPDDPGEPDFLDFLDAASTSEVGVVFLGSYPPWGPWGITLLEEHLDDPAGQDFWYESGDVYYKVTQHHTIFAGWDVDDEITIITGGDQDYTWFSDYSGDTIAGVGSHVWGIEGDAVAVGQYGDSTHVLLASLGPQDETNVAHWTDDGRQIFVNAVSFAAGLLIEAWVCAVEGDDETGDGSEGDPFATIQKGVDEVEEGGYVRVKAGTYEEILEIDKQLTLLGPHAGVHGFDASRGNGEAIIDAVPDPMTGDNAAIVTITSDGVVFKGFTVRNAGTFIHPVEGDLLGNAGIGILGASHCVVENNIAHGNFIGIAIMTVGDDAEDNEIRGNYLYDNVYKDEHGKIVAGEHGVAGGRGIMIDRLAGEGLTTGTVIENNRIRGSADGIYLYAAASTRVGTEGNGNVVFNNYHRGIHVFASVDNPGCEDTFNTIAYNEIYDNGIVGFTGIFDVDDADIYGTMNARNSAGIRIAGSKYTLVEHNEIYNQQETGGLQNKGVRAVDREASSETVLIPSDTVVRYNSIYGHSEEVEGVSLPFQYGVDNRGSVGQMLPDVDARWNWWGHETGPYHDPDNEDGEGNRVSDYVLFDPWWADEEMTVPGSNLPVFNETQETYHATIQEAVDEADAGDTILVSEGTYAEAVVVHTNNLNIQGAEGAILDGAVLGDVSGFLLHGSGITVQGFIIRDFEWGGIDVWWGVGPEPGGNSIVGNVITDTWYGISAQGDNHIIDGNEVTGVDEHGIWIFEAAECSIVGNTVTGSTGYGIFIETAGVHYVTGNVLTENDRGIQWQGPPGSATGSTASFNNIFNNHSFGFWSTANVDATLNWWGDPLGPEHPDNPYYEDTNGDAVSDYVLFIPWLDAPYPDGQPYPAYTISGTITVNPGLDNVEVVATGGHEQTVYTDADGYYELTGVAHGSVDITITPTLAGYEFEPESILIEGPVTADIQDQDFTATLVFDVCEAAGTFESQRYQPGEWEHSITIYRDLEGEFVGGTITLTAPDDGVIEATILDIKCNYALWFVHPAVSKPNFAAGGTATYGDWEGYFIFLIADSHIQMVLSTLDYIAPWDDQTLWSLGDRAYDVWSDDGDFWADCLCPVVPCESDGTFDSSRYQPGEWDYAVTINRDLEGEFVGGTITLTAPDDAVIEATILDINCNYALWFVHPAVSKPNFAAAGTATYGEWEGYFILLIADSHIQMVLSGLPYTAPWDDETLWSLGDRAYDVWSDDGDFWADCLCPVVPCETDGTFDSSRYQPGEWDYAVTINRDLEGELLSGTITLTAPDDAVIEAEVLETMCNYALWYVHPAVSKPNFAAAGTATYGEWEGYFIFLIADSHIQMVLSTLDYSAPWAAQTLWSFGPDRAYDVWSDDGDFWADCLCPAEV